MNRFGQGMSPIAVWQVVRKSVRAANISRAASTHTFRHSCATHILRAGAPIRHLHEMSGHASIETTQVYTRVTITDLKAVHRRFHPREQDPEEGKE
ncbi:MAG TPA: tyrosine-type recombinase/integrase [Steroidobacteraceae bacterium]